MALKKKPVTGMKDILPAEMQIREFVTNQIKETYRGFGFSQIETPCVEHIENLTSKQGGDNEKLIFKILKRGEKLNLETAKEESDVVDFGMRYDLTVPLSRYYANNAIELPVHNFENEFFIFTALFIIQIFNMFHTRGLNRLETKSTICLFNLSDYIISNLHLSWQNIFHSGCWFFL